MSEHEEEALSIFWASIDSNKVTKTHNTRKVIGMNIEDHCKAYYAKLSVIKAKKERGEHLTETETILLNRAEVRNE